MHAPDERVPTDNLLAALAVYVETAAALAAGL
jgi:acetylornithine deacetylase/succinyl-diaminopimelate desuccinylase-like protein